MKLISLLVGVLLVGLFIMKQLDSNSTINQDLDVIDGGDIKTPKIPTSPEGVKEFEGEMNKFLQDSVDKRAKELDESLTQ